jgi:hypothetical protein
MAQRGGKRPGAGRKPGTTNKFSTEAAKAAQATGILPHEWLLNVMRGAQKIKDVYAKDGAIVEIERLPSFEEQLDAAKAAAPFYAPKLAAKAVIEAPEGNPIDELMGLVAQSANNRARPA